jgi:hypothetical protein
MTDYLRTLQMVVDRHPGVRHPFLREAATGRLSTFQWRLFALQHYFLVREFPSYLVRLVPRAASPELLRLVLDAEQRDPTQAKLYERFMTGLGLRPDEWRSAEPLWETRRFIEAHRALVDNAHPTVVLGALGPGHVWAIPRIYPPLMAGLRGRPRGDLECFARTLEDNALHRHLFAKLVERDAVTPSGQAMLRQGATISLQARKLFWDGVARHAHIAIADSA